MLGYIVGGAIVASTCLQVITGICGPAVLAGRLFGKVKCEEPEQYLRLESSRRSSDCDPSADTETDDQEIPYGSTEM